MAQVFYRCRRKKERKWMYLFYSVEMREGREEEIETWEGRVNSIKSDIVKVQQEVAHSMKGE